MCVVLGIIWGLCACVCINIYIYLYTCIEMCTWHKEEKKGDITSMMENHMERENST